MNKKIARIIAVAFGGAAVSAHAAIDTTAITSALTDAGTAVGVVGAAVLVVHVGGKVFKYIRAAM